VAAVTQAARNRDRRLDGDQFTVLYVRAAATAAQRLPADRAGPAFLVGLGIALDDSTILRSNPLTRRLCLDIESTAERTARLAVLGKPTMRRRRDWTQHFAVSCALTVLVGRSLAESAGLLKEHLDMRPGGSGFSFGDLSADLAGVEFAERLKTGELSLKRVAAAFTVADFLPDAAGLREGLSAEQFAKDYGFCEDARFTAEVAAIRKRIRDLPGHRAPPKDAVPGIPPLPCRTP
jgi:hypothetical protein